MKIIDIIKEEIANYINESYVLQNDNFKFSQQLNNSEFNNYKEYSNDFDANINESNITVNWKITFWLNEYGIENLLIDIDSVEGTYKVDLRNKQTDQLQQQTNKDISEIEWKFVVGNAQITKGKSLYVNSLIFDFDTNTCNVNF